MIEISTFVIATFLMACSGALFFAILTWYFHRLYKRRYLLFWAISWFAFSVYLLGGAFASFVIDDLAASHPARLVSSFHTMTAAYVQIAWLLFGTYELSTDKKIAASLPRWLLGGVLTLAAVITLAFAFDPEASSARLFLRVGLKNLVAGIGFLTGGYALFFVWTEQRSLGRTLVSLAFALYGGSMLAQISIPLSQALGDMAPFAYLPFFELFDFLLLFVTGIGLVTWLFEEERAKASRVAATLRESEKRLRGFIDALPGLALVLDKAGRYVEVFAVEERLLYTQAKQLKGRLLHEVLPQKDADLYLGVIHRVLGKEEPQTLEYALDVLGGNRWFEGRVAPIPSLSGEPGMVVWISHDITERKQAEAALQASEERYRGLFENVPISIWEEDFSGVKVYLDSLFEVPDADLEAYFMRHPEIVAECVRRVKILDVNQTTLAMYRTPDKQTLLAGLDQFFVEDSYDAFRKELVAICQGLTYLETEAVIQTPEGIRQEVVVQWAVPPGYEETYARVLITLQDVTERKQATAERERLIGELEAKNAELERFTYTVSHDLKTPLVTIRGFVGMLEKDARSGNVERMHKDVEYINQATDKMGRLLDELLELSRIGRLVNPPEALALTDLAQEATELVVGQTTEQDVAVEIAPSMPVVWGDRLRLLEVYQNLIDNAIKFMGDQPAPHVEIGARRENGAVCCYVRDNGMGIAPAYHEKVFGLFERLNQRIEGTGVGLALVKRIIEVHGGTIWLESEGQRMGTTFFFTLPIRIVPESLAD